MVSPLGEILTYATDNSNGYLSSIMAWLEGSERISGDRNFTGFEIFTNNSLAAAGLASVCETALYQTIKCDDIVSSFGQGLYYGSVGDGNKTIEDSVCASSCGDALAAFHQSIIVACASSPDLIPGVPLIGAIDSIWSGWNETCLVDASTGEYCNGQIKLVSILIFNLLMLIGIMDAWATLADDEEPPTDELCSYCYLTKLKMMQESPYSTYDNDTFETRYAYASTSKYFPNTGDFTINFESLWSICGSESHLREFQS